MHPHSRTCVDKKTAYYDPGIYSDFFLFVCMEVMNRIMAEMNASNLDLKSLLSGVLSYGILAGSFLLKVPQIKNICASASVEGALICIFDIFFFQRLQSFLQSALFSFHLMNVCNIMSRIV